MNNITYVRVTRTKNLVIEEYFTSPYHYMGINEDKIKCLKQICGRFKRWPINTPLFLGTSVGTGKSITFQPLGNGIAKYNKAWKKYVKNTI